MSERTSITITISLTPKHAEMVKHYVEDGKFFSQSEAVRHCILYTFKKDYPDYVVIAKEKIKEKEAEGAMTNEEYCRNIMGGVVENNQCVVKFNRGGNTPEKRFPLATIKDFTEKDLHV